MTLQTAFFLAFQLAFLGLSAFMVVFVTRMKPKVLSIRTDPPPGAHYIGLEEQDDLDPKSKTAMNAQKETEVFYHALMYLDGSCSTRELYKCIGDRWNKYYEEWPEYRVWKIGKSFIETTIKEATFEHSGRVIQLMVNERPRYFIVAGSPRRLVPVDELVTVWSGELKPADVQTAFQNVLTAIYQRPKLSRLPMAAD